MVSHRHVKNLLGKPVYCHTHFGTFKGVIIHTSKHHIILGSVHQMGRPVPAAWDDRAFGMGPGPGGPMGPGPGPGGHGGPGWGLAIPLAAILGITAVGMHWW